MERGQRGKVRTASPFAEPDAGYAESFRFSRDAEATASP
jgi:hypothetical protein